MINKLKKKNQIETKRLPGVTSWTYPVVGISLSSTSGFSFGFFI
jgi:hypothetical protein